MRSIFTTLAFVAVLTVTFPTYGATQRRGGGMPPEGPRYDPSTEVRLHGTVQGVTQQPRNRTR